MDYKKYELKEKRGIIWVNLDKNKALTGIQIRYNAITTNEQSAFKGYVNSYAITNIRVRSIKAPYTVSKIPKFEVKIVFEETQWNEGYATGLRPL